MVSHLQVVFFQMQVRQAVRKSGDVSAVDGQMAFTKVVLRPLTAQALMSKPYICFIRLKNCIHDVIGWKKNGAKRRVNMNIAIRGRCIP